MAIVRLVALALLLFAYFPSSNGFISSHRPGSSMHSTGGSVRMQQNALKIFPSSNFIEGLARKINPMNSLSPVVGKARVQKRNPLNISLPSKKALKAAILVIFLAVAALFSFPQNSFAAPGGGRIGGQSFSAPSSRSSITRQYSAPPPTRQQYQSPSTSLRVMPVPIPVPVSPYGFYSTGVYRSSPIDTIALAAFAIGAVAIIRGRSKGKWEDEETSSLGTGVSVYKFQIALNVRNPSSMSLLDDLKFIGEASSTSTREGLSQVVSEVALALLRRSSEWDAVASNLEYFSNRDAAKAQSAFGRLSVGERSKLEHESGQVDGRFVGNFSKQRPGASAALDANLAVVTIALALRGDSLKSHSSISTLSQARAALQAIGSDVLTDSGNNVLAADVLWTPENPAEVLTKQDVIKDFPELIDL